MLLNTTWLNNADVIALVIALAAAIILAAVRRAHRNLPPGPRGLPVIGYLPFLGPDLHREFTGLAERFGPIVKFWLGNKLCVVITSPEIAREVLRDQDTLFANRDTTVAGTILSYGLNDVAFSPYGPTWKKLRKIFVREMLNTSVLDRLFHLRQEEVRKSIKEIYRNAGEAVDMGSMTFLTAINAVLSMSCGESISSKNAVINATEFKNSAAELMRLLAMPNVSDVFPLLARFDLQGIARDTRRVNGVFEDMFSSAIQARKDKMKMKEKGGDTMRKDFLQYLLELNEQREDSSVTISDIELQALITDAVLGGTDTTATTIEWLMAELLNSPEVMKKACEELTRVVGLDNILEEHHLSKLTYLNAVIKESLRLHPVVPFLLPRFSSKSTTIAGYNVPRGARTFINVWAIQRDPKIWENPLEFRPERFLSEDGANMHSFNPSNSKYIYFPFGAGRRICPGIPLAETLVIHILASFLHMFEWKVPEGSKLDMTDKFGIVVKKRDTLIAIPTPRLSNAKLYA